MVKKISSTVKCLFISLIVVTIVNFTLAGELLAASAVEIDAKANAALKRFSKEVDAGQELMSKAKGVLIFPSIIKAGIGLGGEYGEGALRIKGKTVEYYSTASASLGLLIGAQSKAVVLLFMTKKALTEFRNSKGWEAGVDGSVVMASYGAGGTIDSNTLKQPIIGFVFNNKGLMYDMSLKGSKFTKIVR